MKKHAVVTAIALMVALVASMCGLLAAQITTAKPPSTNINPPGPHAQQPAGGQHPASPSSQMTTPPLPVGVKMVGQGAIAGYVYWDTQTITHKPASSCSGLGSAVGVGTAPKGPPAFEQFKILGTYHNFTYLGNVGSFAVCQYSIPQVPTGQDLQVMINFKQVFVPVVLAGMPPTANNPNHPINISGGSCNKLPPAVPSASVLGSGWWTCGNNAYNVNFVLQPANAGNMTNGGGQLTILSATPQGGANSRQNSTNPGLLSNSNQSHGMLLPAVKPSGAQTPSNPQPGTPGQLLPARPGGNGGTVQLNPQPYPPKGTTSTPGTAGSTVQLNPQPFPPKGRASSLGTKVMTTLNAPKQGQKITNSNAVLQNAQTIATLGSQSQAALAEAAQMKLSLRPAGVQAQPSTTMSATGNAGMLGSSPGVQPMRTTGTISPATVSSSTVNRYGTLQPGMIPGVALQCGHDPTLRILTVSGGPHPAVFTQDATNNHNFYTITGCSFGNIGPNAKAYIYYQGTFHEDFEIQQWSDNFVALNLDPNLTGVDDQKNVTLIIQRADGQQTSKSGNQFYAARQMVLLQPVPQRYFSLNRFRPDQSVLQSWKPTYTSGSSPSVIPNLPGLSAEVHWDITTDSNGTLVGGQDSYDFSRLHSTFVLDSAVMEWRDISCAPYGYQLGASKDNWSIDWYGASGVQVTWQGQQCQNPAGSCGNGGPFVQSDCFQSTPESNYGVDVWVNGPRGLDPWTGKPLP
ncbi:MAG TPA: hypothetical protein VGL74_01345 [Terriglobales bacterium]